MGIKLRRQVIDLLKVLKEKDDNCIAKDLANELAIDYIVLMSSVNELIDVNLGNFKENEIFQISLNKEGLSYLKNGLPERQLLNILLKQNIKEMSINHLLKASKLKKNLFYIGISNMKKNRWIAQSKATGEDKIFLIADDFPDTDLEKFIQKFEKNNNINYSDLSKKDITQYNILNKRKLINKSRKTQRIIYLTEKENQLIPPKFKN